MKWSLLLFVCWYSTMSLALAQSKPSDFIFSPYKTDYTFPELTKAFVNANSGRFDNTNALHFHLQGAFSTMKAIAVSKSVARVDSLTAIEALGDVQDLRAVSVLVSIVYDRSLPDECRLLAQEGIQKHALRSSIAAGEYFAIAQSDDNSPEYLRTAASTFIGRIGVNMPKPAEATMIEARNNIAVKRRLFLHLKQGDVIYRIPLETIIETFVTSQTDTSKQWSANNHRFDESLFGIYDVYLRSDAAFDAMQEIAASPVLKSTYAIAASRALGEVRDERAVARLVNVAGDGSVPAELRLASHESLLRQVLMQSAQAMRYLDATAGKETSADVPEVAKSTSAFLERFRLSSIPRAYISVRRLREMSESSNNTIATASQRELDRLAAVDKRFALEDVQALEQLKLSAIESIDIEVRLAEERLVELRRAPPPKPAPSKVRDLTARRENPAAMHASDIAYSQKVISQFKKTRTALNNRPIYDLGIDYLALYCAAAGKSASFVEMSADSLNKDMQSKIALADAMPILRWKTGEPDDLESEHPGQTIQHEVDLGIGVAVASMVEWQNRIDAKQSKNEARRVGDELKKLSDDGLRQIKIGYLDRLAAPKGRKTKK